MWQEMRSNTDIKPDEVTFNTLMDGCARYGLYDRGLQVLAVACPSFGGVIAYLRFLGKSCLFERRSKDMKKVGIAPSHLPMKVFPAFCGSHGMSTGLTKFDSKRTSRYQRTSQRGRENERKYIEGLPFKN